MQIVLVPSAFVMAIIWLNVIANEVVSIMRAFGLLLSIDTGTIGANAMHIHYKASWLFSPLQQSWG